MRLRTLWLAVGWALVALIVWGSLTPSELPAAGNDKLGHFVAYAAVMFWFAQLYRSRVFWAAGFVALGVLLEFAQAQTGYRAFELYDMLADAIGVALGWAAALVLPQLLPGGQQETAHR